MKYEFKDKEIVTNKKESRSFILKKWLDLRSKTKNKKIEPEKIENYHEFNEIKIEVKPPFIPEKEPEITEKESETKENI